jgi:DNA uptake protein ComE-like DNA-binding protein
MSRNYFQDYFGFSKKEINGIFVLLLILFILILIPYCYQPEVRSNPAELAQFKREIAEFEQSVKSDRAYSYRDIPVAKPKSKSRPAYFEFNPNELSAADWKKLGLSDKQILVIQNYQAKGGKFYKNEDLKKIYVISSEQYQQLEPYIRIDSKKSITSKHEIAYSKIIVDLNQTDSTELQNIRGIGPAFASRIIRYRDRLGGFYSLEQLREVYGVDSAKYSQWKLQLKITKEWKKIAINTATFEELKRHPYLNYKQINAIINYRKQHGPFRDLRDLMPIALLNAEILRKLEPYLSF